MFRELQRRFQDVRTLAQLCRGAEQQARALGRAKPASEHFVLAAFHLPDGSAAAAWGRLGLGPEAFVQALGRQRNQALDSVGLLAPAWVAEGRAPGAAALLPPAARLYEADATGQQLVRRLASSRAQRAGRRLLAGDVLLAAAAETDSSTARALRALGITGEQLTAAATASIAATRA